MCGAPPAALSPSIAPATGALTFAPCTATYQPPACQPPGTAGDSSGRGECGSVSSHGVPYGAATPAHAAAPADELELVRRERDDALQLVQELAAQAAGLLISLDERCAELSHVCVQRDLLRRQLDANRAAMVQCAGLLAKGRLQDCIRLALEVAGVYPCRPTGARGGGATPPPAPPMRPGFERSF